MQTLLIYDVIPESQIITLIPNAPDWLSDVDGLYLNRDGMTEAQEENMLRVSDALCETPDHFNDPADELAGAWVVHIIKPKAVISGQTQVVRCGFIL